MTTRLLCALALAACVPQGGSQPTPAPNLIAEQPPPAPEKKMVCMGQPTEIEVEGWPAFAAARDVDDDGHLDLLVSYLLMGSGGKRFIDVLKGDGDLGFRRVFTAPVGELTSSIAFGYFNDDRALDFVVGDYRKRRVLVFAGNGDGTFADAKPIAVRDKPSRVDVDDVNGDGNQDILVQSLRSIQVLVGKGNMRFGLAPALAVNQAPDGVVRLDLDDDGKTELAVVANDSDTMFVLRADARGGLKKLRQAKTCPGPSEAQAADIDSDGRVDLLYDCRREIEAWTATGAKLTLGSGETDGLAAGDFDDDSAVELVAVARHTKDSTVRLLENSGRGDFEEVYRDTVAGHVSSLRVADMTGDGRDDLIALIWLGREPGKLGIWSQMACTDTR